MTLSRLLRIRFQRDAEQGGHPGPQDLSGRGKAGRLGVHSHYYFTVLYELLPAQRL